MKQIVYIMSSNFSGSHFLSLMIGSHSRFEHIGEIKWLRKVGAKGERVLCGLCGDHEQCPVFKGLSPDVVEDVYEIIFRNVGPGIQGLVDTSKKDFWAERFLADARYEKKFVHLIRDPRALARRWFLDRERSHWNERRKLIKHSISNLKVAIFGDRLDIYVGKWLKQNQKIVDFVNKNKLDCYTVTYHDLAMNDEQVIAAMMTWLGCEYESGQTEYWNFTHHGTTKPEYKWVNNEKIKHFDSRWKEFLSEDQQERIVQNKEVQNFLKQIGVRMHDDGLSVIQAP